MSVVVKRAPADASRVLRIRSQLIVDAGMTHGVFGQPFNLVDGLGRIGVPDEFRVQIARMVWRLQGKPKSFMVKTSSRNSDSWK